MRARPQDRKDDLRDPGQKEQGMRSKDLRTMEVNQQTVSQEWIQVQGKKTSSARRNKTIIQGEEVEQAEKEENDMSLSPIVMEEEEVAEETKPLPVMVSDRTILTKSSSDTNLAAQAREKIDKEKEYLTRSNSMSDLPAHCKDSRLEVLREDFNHLHKVSKHLRRTKEETQRRLKLMELRRNQNHNYMEEIQQASGNLSQDVLCSRVLETQQGTTQQIRTGEPSQKKKKIVQSENKPVTRAAKKQISPRK